MSAVFALVGAAITLVELVLLTRVVSGWVLVLAGPNSRRSGVARVDTVLGRLTDPILAPVRRHVPPLRLGSVAFDLSIPLVLLALSVLSLLLSRG